MMENTNKKIEYNYITDKNKVEGSNKYIYTKFPVFDTHKKIKNYNEKISELILENNKLKKYKNDLEKKIIEESENFEVNFKKYEIAISKALRIGYSCASLCNVLNKNVDNSKRYVIRELCRRCNEFKNNIMKAHARKNTYDKLFINNIIVKMNEIYEQNKSFVIKRLVIMIKNKIKFILHLFISNVFESKYENKNILNSRFLLEKNNKCQSFCYSSDSSTIDKDDKLNGIKKLVIILKNVFYKNVKYSVFKLKNEQLSNLNKKKENDTLWKEDENDKNKYTPNFEDRLENEENENNSMFNKIVRNKDSGFFDLENTGSSGSSSSLPHPNLVYNYLYNQELSKLQEKKCMLKEFELCKKYIYFKKYLNYLEGNNELCNADINFENKVIPKREFTFAYKE
ncbi:conserved Plasmodium protein, unknown function [Plasmodium chabaudi chabaudi]|uniref:Uncharacterized protein n=1 Tax=Plasmodium chabaudi chabaudi TaxID=31271 RepID=A0A1C6XAI5_PLACU|nr:conserved Plasmodium protein, unknown function [Plasmodium chabaudi chabaudi]